MKRLAAGLLMLALACHRETKDAGPLPPLVRVVRATGAGNAPLELRASLAPDARLKLGFKNGGPLAEVLVREGDRVRRGQVLARQDDLDGRAVVRAAGAAREKARRDLDRAERLSAEGALPRSVAEDARTALEAAEAQWAMAQEALTRARLLSPVDGTVFQRLCEPGETIGQGQPVLIVDASDRLVLRAGAAEADLVRLHAGADVNLLLDGGRITPGRIRALGTSPNPGDGLYPVEVDPRRAKDLAGLRPGALVRIQVPGNADGGLRRVPVEAVVNRQDRTYLCVVEGQGAEGVVAQREISLQRMEGSTAVLREPLPPGQRVVAEGGAFLQTGQRVRVKE